MTDLVKANQTKAFGLATQVMNTLNSSLKKEKNFINHLDSFLKMTPEKRDEIFGFPMEESISNLLQKFGNTARGKNIPLYYSNKTGADPDIEKWLPNAEVSKNPIPDGLWKNVDSIKGTTEKIMLETAQKMSLSQAISKFNKMLEEAIFDKLGTCRIIFLEETKKNVDGSCLKLVCDRYSDGRLRLYVDRVSTSFVWIVFERAWFEQQNT